MKIKFGHEEIEVDLKFTDLVKVDSDSESTPPTDDLSSRKGWPEVYVQGDTTPGAFQKFFGVEIPHTTAGSNAIADAALATMLLAPADSRDKNQSTATLHKNGLPDWGWSTPVSGDAPLEKRATHGTARARLEIALDRFFAGHPEERSEADAIVGRVLADERDAILSEA